MLSKEELIISCKDDIRKLNQDIKVLESIIQDKQDDINDLMKVLRALEKVNENYIT